MIVNNKEWTPTLKPKTPKEYPTIPYGYQDHIDIPVNKRLNGIILSNSGSSIRAGGTKVGGEKINNNRRQKHPE